MYNLVIALCSTQTTTLRLTPRHRPVDAKATIDSGAASGSMRRVGGHPRLCTVNPARPDMHGAMPLRPYAQGARP